MLATGAMVMAGSASGAPTLAQTVVPNDDWQTATAVTGVPYQTTENTVDATTAADENPYFHHNTVWFKFTPNVDRRVAISTIGSDYPADFTVYTGLPEYTPDQLITNLTSLVKSYALGKLGTSLTDKLTTAQRMLAANKPTQALENLDAFISQVNGQDGKGLTQAQAVALRTGAEKIKAGIGYTPSRQYLECDYPISQVQWCSLEADTTYHIMVTGRYPWGGNLVFSLLDVPTATLTINDNGLFHPSDSPNTVRVGGTVTCSPATTLYVDVWFIQDQIPASSVSMLVPISCSPETSSWTVDVPDYGYFVTGTGRVIIGGSGISIAGGVYASADSPVTITQAP